VHIEFTLFARVRPGGPPFIAECPPLQLSTQATSAVAARENIRQAARMLLFQRMKQGRLDRMFEHLGIGVSDSIARAAPRGYFAFTVQIPLECTRFDDAHPEERSMLVSR